MTTIFQPLIKCSQCQRFSTEHYKTFGSNDEFFECGNCGYMISFSDHKLNYYRYCTENFIIYYRLLGEYKDKFQIFFRMPQKSKDFMILSDLDISDLPALDERLKNLVVFT